MQLQDDAAKVANDLHQQIVALTKEAIGCAGRAAPLAIACGEILIAQKKQLAKGDWLLWVEMKCEFSDQTARNYMRVASNSKLLLEAGIDFQRLKELYVALGIMPAPPVSEPVKGPSLPPWVKLTAKFDAMIPKLTAPQKVELRTWLLAVLERL